MAFPNKIPLTREDGCVMDSGLKDLPTGAPSTTPSSSWIPKEFTNGNSAELTDDGIITGKWSPEVVQFNS